jgi:hypothetical protein
MHMQVVTLATAHGLLVACGDASWSAAEAAAAEPHQPASLWLKASVRERRLYLVFLDCALRVSLASVIGHSNRKNACCAAAKYWCTAADHNKHVGSLLNRS